MRELVSTVLEALWIFLPILAANQAGKLAKVLGLPFAYTLVSERWLGTNKMVASLYLGPLLGAATVLMFYREPTNSFIGLWLGLGAVLGDYVKSVIKRLLEKPSGSPWWPDRIDFAIGGGLMALTIVPGVTWQHVVIIVLIAWPVHYFGNRWGHKRGWRSTPW